MATLILQSGATGSGGLWSATDTFAVCDATSEHNVFSGTSTLIGTGSIYSGSFAPGIITINGIALKGINKTATTGSFIVWLRNATLASDTAGTSVVASNADWGSGTAAASGIGWHVFPTQGNILLAGVTYYQIGIRSSIAQFSIYQSGLPLGSNWARQLITTTTQAPAQGDNIIIAGNITGSNTGSRFYCDYDVTAGSIWGYVDISKRGVLNIGS